MARAFDLAWDIVYALLVFAFYVFLAVVAIAVIAGCGVFFALCVTTFLSWAGLS